MIVLLALVSVVAGTGAGAWEYAFPVGSTGDKSAPFLIEAWPFQGCPDCVVNEDDKAALKVVIEDLKSPRGAASTYPNIDFHYVDVPPLRDWITSIDDVRNKISACGFGTAGILSPYPTGNVTAFGVRFDCKATNSQMWMSIVMGNDHRPRLAYLLPKYPLPLLRTK